jgi:hypothetical protein
MGHYQQQAGHLKCKIYLGGKKIRNNQLLLEEQVVTDMTKDDRRL